LATRSKLWLASVAACVGSLVLAALVLPRSFRLTALSDVVQCLLLISGVMAFLPRALKAQGRLRFFWSLITLGIALWFFYQLLWTFFEVVLHRDVPDLFSADIVLFLHIVPFMAAIALRPHIARGQYAAHFRRLDFAVLIVWWVYIYVLIVMAWQYAVPNAATYNRNLNAVYLAEKLVLLSVLALGWMRSKSSWKIFYANFFGASLLYAASSHIANWSMVRNLYYSGSLFDIPLAAAMAWFALLGQWTAVREPEERSYQMTTSYGVWIARSGMIAAFSLPLFAAWALLDIDVPIPVRSFRLMVTFVTAFAMGIMVFIRQRLLDRELVHLLTQSRESVDNLVRLQTQIIESEKLASVGQLVGGAAHELNNPITAMLGYSDLLLSTPLTPEQQPLVAKIGQYVRRTKSLVASLISFARQAPAPKGPVDLNTLARTAVKLTQPQWEGLKIAVHTEFDAQLPKVLGDSNQLLQVCLQLVANCLHVMSERGGARLTVSTEQQDDMSILQLVTEAMPCEKGSSLDPEDGLALSACQGILQEHRGYITFEPREDGAVMLRVELPATQSAPGKAKESTVPVLWQSQPFA